MVLPLWARGLRQLDRGAWYAYHLFEILRDEALFAALAPELRAELTELAYADLRTYLPGGSTFEAGLFSWEKALLRNPLLPSRGRVLLGAAGGGRELLALCESGYQVLAFEPNAQLYRGAQSVAARFAHAEVYQAAYADLVQRAQGSASRLPEFSDSFELVWLGWGSFTHLTRRQEQRELLQALRAVAPGAPCVISFFLRQATEGVPGRSVRLRAAIRKTLQQFGVQYQVEPGLSCDYAGGFAYSFEPAEFQALAQEAGYAVLWFEQLPFPHAILGAAPT